MASNTHTKPANRRQLLLICLGLFLFAFAIRTLTWQDNRHNAWKVQTSVTHRYKESARQLVNKEFKTFLTDVPRLGHPPGYPLVLAAVYLTVGDSDTAVQFLQITLDSASVVLLFLISLELFSMSASLVAGVLAALSPQFAYFSVLLLPDSLVVLPILLAVYLVVKSRQRFSWPRLLIAGVLIGVSCWLRANALFLPLFVGIAAALTTTKDKRLSSAVAIIAGAVIAIAPITIKNTIVFHTFIPLSLGSGQTLLEGLADYDPKGTLNIPSTDLGLTRQEAQLYGRPDYAEGLFNVDGIERDRMRVRRALTVIAEHPFWFAGVMGKRALASTRLDPVPTLLGESPVSHVIETSNRQPLWTKSGDEWRKLTQQVSQPYVLSAQPIHVASYHDYVFVIPVRLEHGRLKLTAVAGNRELASTYVETNEVYASQRQPTQIATLPFVSSSHPEVRLVVTSGSSIEPRFILDNTELYDLGPSSMVWLRFVRVPLRLMQTFFKTAWAIPFLLLGLATLIRRKQKASLILLMTVPAYYLIVQSALHTERRYVYVIHYFFIVIVSVSLCALLSVAKDLVGKWRRLHRSVGPTYL